ncbi:hypothetical protein D9758_006755 [Tetrapyrgos nigripes]|uniref:Subtilisin-like protein n=1 Tax=Tetrapyrgos nigripes TaxID=182062 RepID=A0A8H5CX84_9AGAR|nr:hypothetical protein D9758_006755 [Tetrapyrgos nigripes]
MDGAQPHEQVYDSLRQKSVGFDVQKEYNVQDIFVGAALTLKDVAALANSQGVKAVRPVHKISRPSPVFSESVSANGTALLQSTHIMTVGVSIFQGVDKLHAEGTTGQGIKIAIIDSGETRLYSSCDSTFAQGCTGVDYTHPALGGGFGPGFKIAGGYDFVGDNYTGANTPVPDDDPLDQCFGHGTHVTGIVGANPGNPYNISGVAYNATISMYRIFGCAGDTTDDIIVDALLRGVQDGADILTLSVGDSTDGWTEGTASVVASRIASSGKPVTVASGNDGSSGAWLSSSPGNAVDAISVASVDNTMMMIHNATVQGADHDPIPYYSLASFFFEGPLPIYATSNDTAVTDDACNSLPDGTPDLSPYVVIVRRGNCDFIKITQQANVIEKGAQAVLFYNNETGLDFIDIGNNTASLIQAADGEFLVKEFVAGTPITLTFPQDSSGVTEFPAASGGLTNSLTLNDSYGPSNDFFMKPSIAAPGGFIMSTYPVNRGSYLVASGTSMATPYVAGALALLMQVQGKSTIGTAARTLFETTARVVPSSKKDGAMLQTVTQQGAGLINVYDALHTTTLVSPGELILNDTAHLQDVHPITIQNIGDAAKDYIITHLPTGTALTINPDTGLPAAGPVPLSPAQAGVSLSQTSFSLAPGETHTITAQFTQPNANPDTYPVYAGFIQIASGDEQTHVTYMGLAAMLLDKQTLDNSSVVVSSSQQDFTKSAESVVEERAIVAAQNYTFVGDDYPSISFSLIFGTPLVRIDLVSSDFTLSKLPPPISGRHDRRQDSGSAAAVPIVGPIFEFTYLARNDNFTNPSYFVNITSAVFFNGTRVPNGMYKYLMRTLRVTGNPAKEEDYDEYLSPVLGYAVPDDTTT